MSYVERMFTRIQGKYLQTFELSKSLLEFSVRYIFLYFLKLVILVNLFKRIKSCISSIG